MVRNLQGGFFPSDRLILLKTFSESCKKQISIKLSNEKYTANIDVFFSAWTDLSLLVSNVENIIIRSAISRWCDHVYLHQQDRRRNACHTAKHQYT
jgi:hypothetical protein